jgi:hypothetical protein
MIQGLSYKLKGRKRRTGGGKESYRGGNIMGGNSRDSGEIYIGFQDPIIQILLTKIYLIISGMSRTLDEHTIVIIRAAAM